MLLKNTSNINQNIIISKQRYQRAIKNNLYLDLKNQIGGSTINNSSTNTDAPFVSVPVIPLYIYPRMKQFKRTSGIYFNEGGRGGMQTYYELYEFRCTCGNVETNCACKATAPERRIRELSEAEYNQLDLFIDKPRYN